MILDWDRLGKPVRMGFLTGRREMLFSRRHLFQASAVVGALDAIPAEFALAQATPGTPGQILGPFYPMTRTMNETGDLTRVPGRTGRAEGHTLYVMGTVRNGNGELLRGVKLEVWQSNARGRYTHPSDHNPAALDANSRVSVWLERTMRQVSF